MVPPAPDLREILGGQGGRKVLHIEPVRLLEATPVAVEDNCLYDSLRQHCGLTVWDVDADAEIEAARPLEAARLDVREGHPLFSVRLTLSVQDRTIGHTYVRFLANRFHFRLGLQRYPLKD